MEQFQFIGLARPKRENFVKEMTPEEQAIMGHHFAYVEKLHAEGKVVVTGACLDGAFGMVIYKAESEESARSMFENDPLVKSGIANTEFHPFKVSYQ